MTHYPGLCAEATASFSVVSETIRGVQAVLREKFSRKDLDKLISQLQSREQNKLNLTAALHLEKIRERNQAPSTSEGPDRIAALLRDGVISLESQISSCIEEINEVLEEVRCALVDEDD